MNFSYTFKIIVFFTYIDPKELKKLFPSEHGQELAEPEPLRAEAENFVHSASAKMAPLFSFLLITLMVR